MLKFLSIGFLLIASLTFSGCQKDSKEYTLSYRVVKTSVGPATFRVTFTTETGATRQEGPIDLNFWTSEEFNEAEDGLLVNMTVEVLSGDAEFNIFILRDDAQHVAGEVSTSSSPVTISGEL